MERIHIENCDGLITHKFDTMKEAEDFMVSVVEPGNPYGFRILPQSDPEASAMALLESHYQTALNDLVCEKGAYAPDSTEYMFWKGVRAAQSLEKSISGG